MLGTKCKKCQPKRLHLRLPNDSRCHKKFEVREENDDYPTHKPIACEVEVGKLDLDYQKYRQTTSAAKRLEERVRQLTEKEDEKQE